MGNYYAPCPDGPIVFTANQSMALYKFRLGIMLALLRDGFKVVAIAPKDDYSGKLSSLGIQYIEVPLATHSFSPFKDLRYFFRLLRHYARLKPALIFHYTIKPNIYGTLAARIRGNVPSIAIVPGRGHTFQRRNWLFFFVKLLYRFTLRFAKEVWFLNKEDRVLFDEEGLARWQQSILLPGEGVDTKYYVPAQSPKPKGAPVTFLLCGRMLWEKGVGVFVEAAKLVRQKYPSTQFQLLGFVDATDRRAVPIEQIRAWETEGIVNWLGEVEDVRPHFHHADCFALPSFYGEGLPHTLLEAASMQLPLITTDHRGCRRAVREGLNGFLCKPQDAASLAEKMMQFLALPVEKREAMGRASREIAVGEFDETRLVLTYRTKIKALLPNHSTPQLAKPMLAEVVG